MCRWLGYMGGPIEPRELLYDPERSLIEQSRRHAPDMVVPNGDGFGLGWYGRRDVPALFHSDSPAWGDRNLRELAAEISSSLFLAHVQETNCHPFRHDSEVMFHLAITFGLPEDPLGGLERMAGFVESLAADAGVAGPPLQMTVGVTDGERLYAARYASGPEANTLHYSADVESLRQLYPAHERFAHFSAEARAVVSEPLVELPGLWHEVPAGSAIVVDNGKVEQLPFTPRRPD